MTYVLAYVLSVAGGWLIAGVAIHIMRKSICVPRGRFFKWIDVWVGGSERAVATTLLLFAPAQLAVFIGGWMALKLAANWQRSTDPDAPQTTFVAMVGSVVSFSVAIAAPLLLLPDALAPLLQALNG